MAQKITKQEAKSPDGFISLTDRVAHALEGKGKTIVVAAASLFALGLLVVGLQEYNKSREKSAEAEFFALDQKIVKKLQDSESSNGKGSDEDSEGEAKDGKAKDLAEASSVAEEKSPETLQNKAAEELAKYDKALKSFKSTQAAALAGIRLAELYTEYEDPAKAKEVLQRILRELSSKDFLFGLVSLQFSRISDQLGETAEALAQLQRVLDQDVHKHLHPEILLNMGLLYEKQGESEKAKRMYERLQDDFAETSAAESAAGYLRWLRIQKGSSKTSTTEG